MGSIPLARCAGISPAVVEYENCADEAAVVLYAIQHGGHTWPGGKPMPDWLVGRTSRGVDATSPMWAFFREHPLRRK
jgi:polyhydroxybutyrate depolymerase